MEINEIIVNGREIEVDEDGCLVNPGDWNRDVAEFIAEQEKVKMTEPHWKVAYFLRDYYDERGTAPTGKMLVIALGQMFGSEKRNATYLCKLYPQGVRQACKVAGIPEPPCSCGG